MLPVVIVFDTDTSFRDSWKEGIDSEQLDRRFDFEFLQPPAGPSEEQTAEFCLAETRRFAANRSVAAVFVDVVVRESGEALDLRGVMVAERLKRAFPETRIYNITGKVSGAAQQDAVSEAGIAETDGVLLKSYLDGKSFSAGRFFRLVADAGSAGPTASHSHRDNDGPTKTTVPAQLSPVGVSVRHRIDTLDRDRFNILLDQLFPGAQGVIDLLNPGRSGAAVFKVLAKFKPPDRSPTKPSAWLMKVATDRALIERECREYRNLKSVQTPLGSIPQLLRERPTSVQGLTGFVMELKSEMKTFATFAAKTEDVKTLGQVVRNVSAVLQAIYGDPMLRVGRLWGEGAEYEVKRTARDTGIAFLDETDGFIENATRRWRRVRSVLDASGKDHELLVGVSEEHDTRTIHGDLNSRNCLVGSNRRVTLIDFANRRQGHAAADFAKLERDVFFRICDSGRRAESDWASLARWDAFASHCGRPSLSVAEPTSIQDPECRRMISIVGDIRSEFQRVSPHSSVRSYLVAVLYWFLNALGNAELSLQKRAFSVICADNLLSAIRGSQ